MTKKRSIIFLLVLAGIAYGIGTRFNLRPDIEAAKNKNENKIIEKNALAKNKAPQATLSPESEPQPSSASEDLLSESEAVRSSASLPQDSPRWRQELAQRLQRQLGGDFTSEIEEVGSRSLSQAGTPIIAEHVRISIEKPDGLVSRYEALVHPETGIILRTWNQTRFERRQPLKLRFRPLSN